jgi:[glutamine synthetase] adenylyltransferase / [glutamine synthetase]-adenylyl-L-tyrosine phosphorylase
MGALLERLRSALGGGPLDARLPAAAALLDERPAGRAAARLEGDALRGLARALASQLEVARFVGHRPHLVERLAGLSAASLAERAASLPGDRGLLDEDLESALDALRVRRREEMVFAACIDLAGLAPFERVSDYLSLLAETTAQLALALARRTTAAPSELFSVIGMGKIAGREFTYHSDLDLIFLYRGGPENVDAASRIGQRLISYLTTMTGAGIAYAVDTRLRPSGQQGMLVTSFEAFERYQTEAAQTWEHLAMLRARPIAGEAGEAAQVLARVREVVFRRGEKPWSHLTDLRARVERERARESASVVCFKTGVGGLMDVDFLAGGGLLERGSERFPTFPSVAAMLRACTSGPRVERLLEDYRLLRIVEARVRWVTGRGVEELDTRGETPALVADLVEPGLGPEALLERIAAARRRIREAWELVVGHGSIGALGG